MKKAFDQTVRDIKRGVNKKVPKVPSIEQKVLDATTNETWGPHESLLADIGLASRNYHEYQMIMSIIWKRVFDIGKNWRRVYKSLTVLEYLVAIGLERVIDEIREHSYEIATLSEFQYIDHTGSDQGNNVRKKSQSLVALVNDKDKIQEVREKAAANWDKNVEHKSPEQNLGIPPSYGDAAPPVAPSPVTAAPPPPPPAATTNTENNGFDEFDPRGSFQAAPPPASGGADMDLFGDPFSLNSLALVPVTSASSDADAFINQNPPGHTFVAASSTSTTSSQAVPIQRPSRQALADEYGVKVFETRKNLKIPLHVIKDCTEFFSERNFIGKGGYGRVYKGILTWEDHVNQFVAVKRLDVTGFQGNKEFLTEVTMLSRYQHENIITLIGFCDDDKELILVYEYASHGSLDTYLSGDIVRSHALSWPQLLKICIGVASALEYLHNQVAEKHRIIHRDIKSANVLLDENLNAKLADFGLAKIGLANQQNTFVITNIAGTYGYNDPLYERTGYLTKESDVYSFGVVLFEVLCGRLACVGSYHDERRFLRYFARTCYKNGHLADIIDHRIKKDINPRTLSKFSDIAYQCLQETREERPTIAEVAFQLKEAWEIQVEDEGDQSFSN